MFIIICTLGCGPLRAFHIVGGDISVAYQGKPGLYQVVLTQFWDEVSIQQNSPGTQYESSIQVFVFSKRTHTSVQAITLDRVSRLPVAYDNPACAKTTGLRTSAARYEATIQFDPSLYTDPAGYYLVWERCCRNGAVINILTPSQVGQVFYAEIPPMRVGGSPFVNSSPTFVLPSGKYACVNQSFSYDFHAEDADGDQLRYQLVAPVVGYTSSGTNNTYGTGNSYSSYPNARWAPGFSDPVMITGSQPLRIDPGTGVLSLNADRTGLFAFAVEVTEYRNGQPIGKARREFQLLVTDCGASQPPPAPVVMRGAVPIRTAALCRGDSLRVQTADSLTWAFQWQKDGVSIAGATSSAYVITTAGTYRVIKSYKAACARDTASELVKVTVNPPASVTLTAAGPTTFCAGQSVALTVRADANAVRSFRWLLNGQPAANLPNAPTVTVGQGGRYVVEGRGSDPAGSCPGRDSLLITVRPLPQVSLSASVSALCGTDSVRLTALTAAGNRVVWQREGVAEGVGPTLIIRQPGMYAATVTDSAGCQTGVSMPLRAVAKPIVTLDSIPTVCDPTAGAVAIVAQPPGGTLTGDGVTNRSFNPAQAGPGPHVLTYQYVGAEGCSGRASRVVSVQAPINLRLPARLTVFKNEAVTLPATADVPLPTIRWSPAETLSDPTVLRPVARTGEPTTYVVDVRTALGCTATAQIQLDILRGLSYPSAFSPNHDGVNDTWVIGGLDDFPNAEILIYNRWGAVIYHAKGYPQPPWDGTFGGQPVEPGPYAFRILTHEHNLEYKGQVMVLH